jgi:hypothetical protein
MLNYPDDKFLRDEPKVSGVLGIEDMISSHEIIVFLKNITGQGGVL